MVSVPSPPKMTSTALPPIEHIVPVAAVDERRHGGVVLQRVVPGAAEELQALDILNLHGVGRAERADFDRVVPRGAVDSQAIHAAGRLTEAVEFQRERRDCTDKPTTPRGIYRPGFASR